MKFVWDERKARANLAKHGVAFASCENVCRDGNALIELDPDDSEEERWRIIAMGESAVLLVVFVERGLDTIRIISARRANRHEEDRYYRQASPEE